MLQTIEVEIDAQGVIHALQALPPMAERRALLTLVVPQLPEKTIILTGVVLQAG